MSFTSKTSHFITMAQAPSLSKILIYYASIKYLKYNFYELYWKLYSPNIVQIARWKLYYKILENKVF